MRVRSKKRYLTFGIASVGAVRVGFDELSDGKAIGSFGGRNIGMHAHKTGPFLLVTVANDCGRTRTNCVD
jgi:hypothetical protein